MKTGLYVILFIAALVFGYSNAWHELLDKVDPAKEDIPCDSILRIDFKGIHKVYSYYDTVIVRDTIQPGQNKIK